LILGIGNHLLLSELIKSVLRRFKFFTHRIVLPDDYR
jgi:hypothetical protein